MIPQAELTAMIERNLPGEVGKTLQAVLDKGALEAKKVDSLTAELNKSSVTIERLSGEVSGLNDKLKLAGDIAAREAAVTKRENDAQVAHLTVQLEAERRCSTHATQFALGLVRNIEFRENLSTSKHLPVGGGAYGTVQVNDSTSSSKTAA